MAVEQDQVKQIIDQVNELAREFTTIQHGLQRLDDEARRVEGERTALRNRKAELAEKAMQIRAQVEAWMTDLMPNAIEPQPEPDAPRKAPIWAGAVQVLGAAGCPLSVPDIFQGLQERGWEFGANGREVVRNTLLRKNKIFRHWPGGKFGLVQWPQDDGDQRGGVGGAEEARA